MPRVSIRQFRATLTSSSDQGSLARAYRELARRPEVALAMAGREWAPWPPLAAPAATA